MHVRKLACVMGLAGVLNLGARHAASEEPPDGLPSLAARVAVATCATCHGPRGQSVQPKFPVLAGQHANYLLAQLQAFRAQTRGDPDAIGYMWGMAGPLSDELMGALADYYSAQTSRRGEQGDAAQIARGRQIYQNGDSNAGIPPCAACHGSGAAGTDTYPRLAGQHVQYLLKQLRSFQNNMRNVAIMHGVAKGLNDADMRAVATYLQSL
ncbi:MAG TPA: c-type cytochrome [Steroidobacteraceae bacterium]|jgi:cytochrome c553|nr:c-type cytochrome [Steroidobacteraceae bacterium]